MVVSIDRPPCTAASMASYWLDCHNRSSYADSALSIQLTVTQEDFQMNLWFATAFTGTMTWNIAALPDGCPGAQYQMGMTGTSS